jgi:hypothetical protein
VVREGVGAGGEMNQALYAHMNNKRKMKKNRNSKKKKEYGATNVFHTANTQQMAHSELFRIPHEDLAPQVTTCRW